MTDSSKLEAVLELARKGVQVVPCHPRGKTPSVGKDWQSKATDDESQIEKWHNKQPNANWGALAGERSGIIDFEGDGPEADNTLGQIFGDDVPVTPTYNSSRGKHRLFKYRDDLPGQGKNHFKVGDLEIRTGYGDKAAQSVVPPSVHERGIKYEWLPGLSPSECDFAEISDVACAAMWNVTNGGSIDDQKWDASNGKTKRDWKKIEQGVPEGERNEAAAAWIGSRLRNLANPFDSGACKLLLCDFRRWNADNKPPLKDGDIERTFDSILERQRKKISSQAASEKLVNEQSAEPPDGYKLRIKQGNPRQFLLTTPFCGVELKLTEREYRSAYCVIGALMQHDAYPDEKEFTALWEGNAKKGLQALRKQVFDHADCIEATAEECRDLVVLQAVLEYLEEAKPENRNARIGVNPIKRTDGSVCFIPRAVSEKYNFSPERFYHKEFMTCFRECGAVDKQLRDGSGKNVRCKMLTAEQLKAAWKKLEIGR